MYGRHSIIFCSAKKWEVRVCFINAAIVPVESPNANVSALEDESLYGYGAALV